MISHRFPNPVSYTHLISLIRKKSEKGFGINEIADILELDVCYAKKVLDLLAENPGKTDMQVAELIIGQV